jgi:hypothetical protein
LTRPSSLLPLQDHEERRKKQFDRVFFRTKAEQLEEENLLREAKALELSFRRFQKDAKAGKLAPGAKAAAAAAAAAGAAAGAATAGMSAAAALAAAPGAVPAAVPGAALAVPGLALVLPPLPKGTPTMRSRQHMAPVMWRGKNVSDRVMKRVELELQRFGIRSRPIPTERVSMLFTTARQTLVDVMHLRTEAAKLADQVREARLQYDQMRMQEGGDRMAVVQQLTNPIAKRFAPGAVSASAAASPTGPAAAVPSPAPHTVGGKRPADQM